MLATWKTQKPRRFYRAIFQNQGEHCELYAVRVAQGSSAGIFGSRADIICRIEPANAMQAQLRLALAQVKRSYIPLQNIAHIDEVPHKISPLRAGIPARGK